MKKYFNFIPIPLIITVQYLSNLFGLLYWKHQVTNYGFDKQGYTNPDFMKVYNMMSIKTLDYLSLVKNTTPILIICWTIFILLILFYEIKEKINKEA